MKKFNYPLLLLWLLIIAVSCSKEIDPTNPENPDRDDSLVTFFSLNVDDNDLKTFKNSYLLINDVEGNLISYQKVSKAKLYEFKASKNKVTKNFMLTFLLLSKDTVKNIYEHSAISIANIPVNAIWNLKVNRGNEEAKDKVKFDLEIEKTVNILSIAPFLPNGVGYQTGYTYSNNKFEIEVTKANKYALTIRQNNTEKYSFLNDVKEGDVKKFKFSELKDFDSSLAIKNYEDFNYFNYELVVVDSDLKEGSMYTRSLYSADSSKTMPKLYFLNEFDKYVINMTGSVKDNTYHYEYKYRGKKPTSPIELSKYNFVVNEKAFFNLKFTSNITNYDFRETEWSWPVESTNNNSTEGTSKISWSLITDDKVAFKVPRLPKEIKENYPNFDVTKLKYSSSIIKKGRPYQKFLDAQLGFNPIDKQDDYLFEEMRFRDK